MAFGQIVAGNEFDKFLQSHAQEASLGNGRFVARNFLLDEGVSSERQSSYATLEAMKKHTNFDDWREIHEDYLYTRVFLAPQRLSTQIDRTDEKKCPETFRHPSALRTFGTTEANLNLIRIERAQPIAKEAGFNSVDELLALADEYLASRSLNQLVQQLSSALEIWSSFRDRRPMWASFWEDVYDLFEPAKTQDSTGWPNELRDRLGLYHLDPAIRPIHVFVFRYAVSDLPTFTEDRNLRPMAVPTVLDGQFGEAFCPAPYGQSFGSVVYLGKETYRLRRELLHPAIQFSADHLFKVGTITQPLPADLTPARKEHLHWLRAETGHVDYANLTDGDLL